MSEAEHIFHIPPLTERVKQLETDMSDLKREQPSQEGQIETIALEVQSLHIKIDTLDQKVDALDQKVDELDLTFATKFDGLDSRVTRIEQTMATKFELQQMRNWLEDQFAELKHLILNHTHR